MQLYLHPVPFLTAHIYFSLSFKTVSWHIFKKTCFKIGQCAKNVQKETYWIFGFYALLQEFPLAFSDVKHLRNTFFFCIFLQTSGKMLGRVLHTAVTISVCPKRYTFLILCFKKLKTLYLVSCQQQSWRIRRKSWIHRYMSNYEHQLAQLFVCIFSFSDSSVVVTTTQLLLLEPCTFSLCHCCCCRCCCCCCCCCNVWEVCQAQEHRNKSWDRRRKQTARSVLFFSLFLSPHFPEFEKTRAIEEQEMNRTFSFFYTHCFLRPSFFC